MTTATEEQDAMQALWKEAFEAGERLSVDGETAVVVPLQKGFFSIVSEQDAELVQYISWRPYVSKRSRQTYVVGRPCGSQRYVRMHRLIVGDVETDIDHINLCALDNRRTNLRLASHSQNCANVFLRRHNSTGYKGVVIQNGHYAAQICANGRNRRLGKFNSAVEAALAYDLAAREAFGSFARTNFREEVA